MNKLLAVMVFAWMSLASAAMAADGPVVRVYKSPTCGCCGKWVKHLEDNGFRVEVTDVADVTPIKQENSVPVYLNSCHTAMVDGYIIEGHVPAGDILRLLKDRPAVAGIAVPGMPAGSPGMESPNPQAYKVVTFDNNGVVNEFSSHGP